MTYFLSASRIVLSLMGLYMFGSGCFCDFDCFIFSCKLLLKNDALDPPSKKNNHI